MLVLESCCTAFPYSLQSSWNLTGALILFYRDRSLHADVVTPNLKIEEHGLTTIMYSGANYTHHPYSEKLFVYHFGRKTTYHLTDAETARRYFQTFNPDYSNGCPPGREGFGVPVFYKFMKSSLSNENTCPNYNLSTHSNPRGGSYSAI